MIAAKPTDVPLNAALLVRALDAWLAVERLQVIFSELLARVKFLEFVQ
jgi:hypothetical protein